MHEAAENLYPDFKIEEDGTIQVQNIFTIEGTAMTLAPPEGMI